MSFRNAKGGYIRPGYDPLEVANPPTGASATAGSASASVSFTAPSNTGGGAITNYYAVSNPGQITASSVTSPISVSGLTNGTEYTFKVWGENSYGPSAYSAPTGSVTPVPPYIEDVFSTYLYNGNDTSRTITNGIDLVSEGGLVWIKDRNTGFNNVLFDTNRGALYRLISNAMNSSVSSAGSVTGFTSSGFSLGDDVEVNFSSATYASWTFRKAEKFFDVVTYTGNGADNRAISHNLGSTPGCVILKCTSTGSTNWLVQHRSVAADRVLILNGTNASFGSNSFSDQYADSTSFYVDNTTESNNNGSTYVAYLFAHDAGGFGANGTDNVISCGSFTTDGSGNATVSLGYEPQWVMYKKTNAAGSWTMIDVMRGMTFTTSEYLFANLSDAAFSGTTRITPVPNGFDIVNGIEASSSTYIYIAIRRGPMRTPTTGTSVFSPVAYNGTGTTVIQTLSTNFPVDLYLTRKRSAVDNMQAGSRLVGQEKYLLTDLTAAEQGLAGGNGVNNDVGFASNIGIGVRGDWNNPSSPNYSPYILEAFRRAPGFFDTVCWTQGGGSSQTINHNLTVTPEFIINKTRSVAESWYSYHVGIPNTMVMINSTSEASGSAPCNTLTSTTFNFNLNSYGYSNGTTWVSYLFASVAGVSKVGSYTGTGTTLQVNCGFTGGARFVMIKRTDSTGDWYVWDSARGIVAGNDPYLLLNSTAAEVTNTDYVDTYSAGFEISSTAPAAINANGGTFIYLAIS